MATNPATDPFLARTLAAMENPPPMFRTCAAWATPAARTPPVPSIPCRSPTQPSGFNHTADAAPKCDHDTDTLASFLAWRSATHQIENIHQTVEALLSLMCQFVRAKIVGIASRRSPLRRGAPVEASPQQRRRQQRCGEQWHSNGSGKGILATTAWHSPIAASLAFFLLSFYILLHNREKDDASRLSDTIKLQRYNHQVVNSFSLSLSLSLCSCEDSQRNGDRANFYRL